VKPRLLPCPFCGAHAEVRTGVLEGARIECRECGAEGPKASTIVDRAARWNVRTESPAHGERPRAV
jgi:Lar family restriction alleviation protein